VSDALRFQACGVDGIGTKVSAIRRASVRV
jgi:hypothetical protein